jgi:hypothetical protein
MGEMAADFVGREALYLYVRYPNPRREDTADEAETVEGLRLTRSLCRRLSLPRPWVHT